MKNPIRTSSSYIATVANDEAGRALIDALRKTIKLANATREKKFRVCLRARLGKNNPYARFYGSVVRKYYSSDPRTMSRTRMIKGGRIESGNVRVAHASRFDIYVRVV